MYPDEFDYYRADTVEEALDLLAEHEGSETELLAGGHSLLPTMKSGLASPDVLIDVGAIDEMTGVEVVDGTVSIGAATTYADVLDAGLSDCCPAFAAAVGEVGDAQVRNRGTVGGNLAHADPGADLPGAALATNATVRAVGSDGEREIPVDDFFLATYATALEDDELLTAVELPTLADGDAGAYVKKASESSGYATVGVAARVRTDGQTVAAARVGVNGALTAASRLDPVEDALDGARLDEPDLASAAAARATDGLESWQFMDDLQASAEFRAHLLEVYVERALDRAIERAG